MKSTRSTSCQQYPSSEFPQPKHHYSKKASAATDARLRMGDSLAAKPSRPPRNAPLDAAPLALRLPPALSSSLQLPHLASLQRWLGLDFGELGAPMAMAVGMEMGAGAAMAMAVLLLWSSAVEGANTTSSGFPVPSYYVMGDAFMDAGNNNFIKNYVPKANFKPYGMTLFKTPTGRFSDGRIFPDLLAVIMKLPRALPSKAKLTINQKGQCVNYASGGSAILKASSVALGVGNAITLESQMTSYETDAVDVIYEFGVDQALLILNDAIYHLSFGTVDILAYFTKPAYAASAGSITAFVTNLAKEYLYYVNRLYGGGARKVLVFGIGPIHKSPLGLLLTSQMAPADSNKFCAGVDAAVRQLNHQLQLMVTQINADNALGMEHESLQLVFADVYGAVMDITKFPAKHGFTDVKNACCGGGKFGAEVKCGSRGYKVCSKLKTSLYWNDMQFTEAGSKRLFKLLFDGSSFVRPFSVKHLAKMLIPGVPY